MKVTATLNNLRIAPRKSKLVADLIKGMDVNDAIGQLEATIKRSSDPVIKLLKSAVANAENNFGLDKDNLYVFDAVVGAGPTLKRWMPRAYGRAARILKRTSQITIVLEERIEGKGRKTKEEMAKIMEKRMKDKKKQEKERSEEERKESEHEEIHSAASEVKEKDKIKKDKSKGKSWGGKIFRRKSM